MDMNKLLHKFEDKHGLKKNDAMLALILGLIGGFILGFILGLGWGLGILISVSLIASIRYFNLNIWVVILIIIILAELIFLFFDKKKPKKNEKIFWFTVKRKVISHSVSAFFVLELNGLYQLSIRGLPYIRQYYPEIVKWLGYIGIALLSLAVILGLLYVYIKLNSLKYNR